MTALSTISRLTRMRPELTARTAVVLLTVTEATAPPTVRALAASSGFSKPCITRVLNVLERRGLAKRVGDPKDRRSIFVHSTAAGRKYCARLGNGAA